MRATIKMIAERAGVSIGTVDRVLHDRPYVKEEVRRRVLEVMEELDYQPNRVASALATSGMARHFAIIQPTWESYVGEAMAAGVAKFRQDRQDYNVSVTIHPYRQGRMEDCLHLLEQNPTGISVVLLDIHMTGIDGFTVLEAMSQRGMLEEIPVIMISSEDNVDTVRRAFDLGASDYISRPFDARVVYQRITNTIRMYAKQRRLSAMVADQVSQKEKRSQMMIGILSRVVERRNGESRTHVQHISTLTGMLLDHLVQKTETYPLTQEMRRTISMASVLHDIGKMEIGEQVLNSPEPRTPEDEETMRQHTLLGARMLEELDAYRDEDFVRVAYQICRWHHERYDGSGYPDQLVGEQIPIAAQVVGLADAYETLTTGSGSQPPVPCAAAVQMLCTGEAGAFNPVLLDCLREIENEIDDAMRRRPESL